MEVNKVIKQPLILRESKSSEKDNEYSLLVNNDRVSNLESSESSMFDSINPFAKNKILPENNKISTSKYTWINCAPKIILEQFSKMANVYFLIIAFMQMIHEISISQGKPVILLPLSVVIITNGIKDFIEDWKRKKSDDEENMRKTEVYSKEKNTFVSKKWQDIKLGDIILVKENEYFPADLVIINSSEPEGMAYIETKNLDGETNLKFKQSHSKIANIIKTGSDLNKFSGRLECRKPNEFIYEFDAKFYMNKTELNQEIQKK
jgi:phospholipid-transporting ATPase